jgi:hypothetical protein
MSRTLSHEDSEEIKKGGGIGFGYNANFWFPVGLARVKAKTLSGVRSGTQVRSGSGQVTKLTWLRRFP